MAKKIRVYELARELGLSNKEALDLCEALGIGVKSHSSSIEDAQADRVRRKADAEGLRRPSQPEEAPAPAGRASSAPAPAAEPAAETASRPAARSTTERPAARPAPDRPAPDRPTADRPAAEAPPAPRPAPERPAAAEAPPRSPGRPADPRLITSRPGADQEIGRPAPRPPVDRPPVDRPPVDRPTLDRPPVDRPAAEAPPTPRPAPERPAAGHPPAERPAAERPAAAAADASAPGPGGPGAGAPSAARRPPMSPSGKPIPPPPGARRPPMSASGRPIPPPPGRPAMGGGRPGGPPGSTGRPPGAGAGRPPMGAGRPGTGYGGRPAGGAPGGGGRPGGFGGRPGGGGGGFGGRPGGGGFGGGPPQAPGRGGPPGRGRPPQRRSRRRRHNLEELEPTQPTVYTPSNAPIPEGEVIIERGSTAQDLGPKLFRSAGDVVRFLLLQGEMVTATQSLSDEMIELFADEVGAKVRLVDPGEEKEAELQARYFDDASEEDEALQRPRPPVITVMGHVDHGKTLLLDRIRETNVVAGEAGGITQHIGAYQVERDDRLVTFIDTPGHEAFTAMRARGAQVTDIAVLVVAADDGVMPQTVEAINHAKSAEVPIVVAINKIDRADADPNRVMQQLSEHGLVPEQWGGDTIMVEISALQNLGIDDLLEQLLLLADVEELTANPEGRARGVVLEANLDVGRGPVATVLVQKGTLRVGDTIVAGAAWGRVRALVDDHGDNVKEALPSMPVLVLGYNDVPRAGDEFRVTTDLGTARTIGEAREQRFRSAGYAPTPTASGARLEDIFEQIQRGESATLNLILKADVQGSLEALTESLRKLERDEVRPVFVHRAVGGITENDVQLAAASNATIIGFNVRPDRKARELAEASNVEIRTYEIIYKILEDIEAAMVGMLAPEVEEVVTGDAEVREIFRVPRVGAVAGCYVRNGAITRGSKVRFLREGVIIWKGTISSLRRFKDDVREVQSGFECGIGLSDFQDLRRGDIIETFEEREIPRT